MISWTSTVQRKIKRRRMFKIEALVEDKRVGDALRALAGIARGVPVATPMVNAEPQKNGSMKAKTNGTMLAMLEQHLLENKATEYRAADFRAFLKSIGRPPGNG